MANTCTHIVRSYAIRHTFDFGCSSISGVSNVNSGLHTMNGKYFDSRIVFVHFSLSQFILYLCAYHMYMYITIRSLYLASICNVL